MQTSEGFVPLTALPSLSPTLSVVQIPSGDYESYQKQLYLNINLRRCVSADRSKKNAGLTKRKQAWPGRTPWSSLSRCKVRSRCFLSTIARVYHLPVQSRAAAPLPPGFSPTHLRSLPLVFSHSLQCCRHAQLCKGRARLGQAGAACSFAVRPRSRPRHDEGRGRRR